MPSTDNTSWEDQGMPGLMQQEARQLAMSTVV